MGSRIAAVLLLCASFAFVSPPASADDERRLDGLVTIRKNTGPNRVEYGVQLDAQCRPVGNEPVYPYFRWLTRGPTRRRELSWLERRAYGVRTQKVTRRDEGGHVDFSLRALPGRWMRIEVKPDGDGCRARALMRIDGQEAELLDVFLVLTGPMSVDHVEVTGEKLRDRARVMESITP